MQNSNLMSKIMTAVVAGLLLTGCSDLGDVPVDSQNGTPMTISYQRDIRPLLDNARCSARGSCHGSGAGSLTISSTAFGDILRAEGDHGPLVVAGDAQASSLYVEISAAFRFQGQMPLGGSALTIEQQELVRDWINDGAQDN